MQCSSDVSINDEGLLEIDNVTTAIDVSNFLFTLQQPIKKLYHPFYERILEEMKTSPYLVPNSKSEEIVKPKVFKTKFLTKPKTKSTRRTPEHIKMIEKVPSQKDWPGKELKLKEHSKIFVTRGLATYSTASKIKSAFAEDKFRSLENFMYKQLENKWKCHYISKLSQFVSTIISRVNRVTSWLRQSYKEARATL